MKIRPLLLAAMAIGATWTLALAPARAEDPGPVLQFHPIASEDLLSFATRFFYKHFPSPPNWSFGIRFSRHENWITQTQNYGLVARADIGGKGSDDLVLIVNSSDWCEDNGCLGAIFRPGDKGYEYICSAALVPDGTRLMAQRENGYRLVETKATIIHWYEQQPYDSGTLCDAESRQ